MFTHVPGLALRSYAPDIYNTCTFCFCLYVYHRKCFHLQAMSVTELIQFFYDETLFIDKMIEVSLISYGRIRNNEDHCILNDDIIRISY